MAGAKGGCRWRLGGREGLALRRFGNGGWSKKELAGEQGLLTVLLLGWIEEEERGRKQWLTGLRRRG
jgi:hypothetical protein